MIITRSTQFGHENDHFSVFLTALDLVSVEKHLLQGQGFSGRSRLPLQTRRMRFAPERRYISEVSAFPRRAETESCLVQRRILWAIPDMNASVPFKARAEFYLLSYARSHLTGSCKIHPQDLDAELLRCQASRRMDDDRPICQLTYPSRTYFVSPSLDNLELKSVGAIQATIIGFYLLDSDVTNGSIFRLRSDAKALTCCQVRQIWLCDWRRPYTVLFALPSPAGECHARRLRVP